MKKEVQIIIVANDNKLVVQCNIFVQSFSIY